jgi:hypothetical protein
MLKSLLRLLVAAFAGVSLAGVIGAVLAKRRIVPAVLSALAGVTSRT